MQTLLKLQICLIGNILILAFVIILVCVFADGDDGYWQWGPHENLILISVKINAWNKYIGLLIVIATIRIAEVFVSEVGGPILGFNIYNPDKKIITDFTKNELQFYANTMFMVSSLRSIFSILIYISQIDLALWSTIMSEMTSFWTIRLLLNEKTFKKSIIMNENETEHTEQSETLV